MICLLSRQTHKKDSIQRSYLRAKFCGLHVLLGKSCAKPLPRICGSYKSGLQQRAEKGSAGLWTRAGLRGLKIDLHALFGGENTHRGASSERWQILSSARDQRSRACVCSHVPVLSRSLKGSLTKTMVIIFIPYVLFIFKPLPRSEMSHRRHIIPFSTHLSVCFGSKL